MAWHLSEVLRSHCDQILLCPRFIVLTAWGMLGFVLPTVAIHHLWRKRKSALALCFPPPPPSTHTHTHTHTSHLSVHTPLSYTLCWDILSFLFLCTRVLLNYPSCFSHTPHSIPGELSLWAMWKDRRGGMCCSSIQKHLARKDSLPSPPINLLLKGGCNLSSVNVLGVESILPGFSNLGEKRKTLMSNHLIKARVSLDHILGAVNGWGGGGGVIVKLLPPFPKWLKLIFN